MSFRHYTKLKEIASKYGCDSSGCNTNGALLDRIYESPVSPVVPTGQIDAKIDIQNIKARFIRPVEGHLYFGSKTIPTDGWLLELENVIGYKVEGSTAFYTPVGTQGYINSINCMVIFNDVENSDFGNLMFCVLSGQNLIGFTDEQVEGIKTKIPYTFVPDVRPEISGRLDVCKLTITEIVDG